MRLNTNIPLTAKQVKMYNALNSGLYTEACFYGSSRSGKTFLILYTFIVWCIFYKANFLIVRNTFTSLQSGMIQQTMPAVLNAIAGLNGFDNYQKMTVNGNSFVTYNGKDCTLTFFNGAYIKFASIRSSGNGTDSQYDKVLSTEWCGIFADEVSEIDFTSIGQLKSRLAQKVRNKKYNKKLPTMLITALNPTSKLQWCYQRYVEHRGAEAELLSKDKWSKFLFVHFSVNDNKENISEQYIDTLESLSRGQQKRFLEGEFADVGEGEVFKTINWSPAPNIDDIEACLIYTDPSAKDKEVNDYKASALLARAKGKIFLLDVRAVQGTSHQMLENIYDLAVKSPLPPRIIFEKKQLPLDFETTFDLFQQEKNWICPLEWDTRNCGDKYTFIEATLEPLFRNKQFLFCDDVRESGVCEVAIDQFIRFSKVQNKDKKDDIPDACAKGTSLLTMALAQSNVFHNAPVVVQRKRIIF